MPDQAAPHILQAPPESGELRFDVPLAPVSVQAQPQRKREFTERVRNILRALYAFTLTSDVQLEIQWWVHERVRYESDAAPDVDNILKPLLDGLSGPEGILVDDSQVQHISVGWVDTTTQQQTVEVSVRLHEALWIRRGNIEFVEFSDAMCWPMDRTLPVRGQEVMIQAVQRMLSARNELMQQTDDYYTAQFVMPWQRFFHVSRTRGFPRISYHDYLARIAESKTTLATR